MNRLTSTSDMLAALAVMAALRDYAGDERPEMRSFREAWVVAKLEAERLAEAYIAAWKSKES